MVILGIFHCACAKRPYIHFRYKIWRHLCHPRPRFLLGRDNFRDSLTFNAYIGLHFICRICCYFLLVLPYYVVNKVDYLYYLIFAWVSRTLWHKVWAFWGKIGEVVMRYWPLKNSFFLFRDFTSVPILVKIDQEMRPWPWECSQINIYTDWHTDRLTDANRFYNLSHAVCYIYGSVP